jgi:FkbM family methyltransferase
MEVDYFLDIGSNVGSVALQAKVLFPKSKVIALEPAKDTFEILKEKSVGFWCNTGIKLYNIALGDGKEMSFHRKGGAGCGMNKFYNQDEKDKWRKDAEYVIESKTIRQIFEDYKIDTSKNYIIKVDCEGGERHLLQQREDFNYYVRNSLQLNIEIHQGWFGGYEVWNEWIKEMNDTHQFRVGEWVDKKTPDVRYRYVPCEGVFGEHAKNRWTNAELISRKVLKEKYGDADYQK